MEDNETEAHTKPTSEQRHKLRRDASRTRPTEKQPWFRTGFSRQQVIETLQDCPAGTFIVRDSSRPGHYALSVVGTDHRTVHMLIVPVRHSDGGATGYKLGERGKRVFSTVYELVHHFIENPQQQSAPAPTEVLVLQGTNDIPPGQRKPGEKRPTRTSSTSVL